MKSKQREDRAERANRSANIPLDKGIMPQVYDSITVETA
jgi:hypothetical protein